MVLSLDPVWLPLRHKWHGRKRAESRDEQRIRVGCVLWGLAALSFRVYSTILILCLGLSCLTKLQRLKGKLIFFAWSSWQGGENQMQLCEFIIILFKEKTHKNSICSSLELMYPPLQPLLTKEKSSFGNSMSQQVASPRCFLPRTSPLGGAVHPCTTQLGGGIYAFCHALLH